MEQAAAFQQVHCNSSLAALWSPFFLFYFIVPAWITTALTYQGCYRELHHHQLNIQNKRLY
jgi:hypothetical protein